MSRKVRGSEVVGGEGEEDENEDDVGLGEIWHSSITLAVQALAMADSEKIDAN